MQQFEGHRVHPFHAFKRERESRAYRERVISVESSGEVAQAKQDSVMALKKVSVMRYRRGCLLDVGSSLIERQWQTIQKQGDFQGHAAISRGSMLKCVFGAKTPGST